MTTSSSSSRSVMASWGEEKGMWGLSRPDTAFSGKGEEGRLGPMLQALEPPGSHFGLRKTMPRPRVLWGPRGLGSKCSSLTVSSGPDEGFRPRSKFLLSPCPGPPPLTPQVLLSWATSSSHSQAPLSWATTSFPLGLPHHGLGRFLCLQVVRSGQGAPARPLREPPPLQG